MKSWTWVESIRLCRARRRHFITAWPVKWDEKPVKWLHTQHLGLLSDSSHPSAYFSISEKVRSKHLQMQRTVSKLRKDNFRVALWPTSDLQSRQSHQGDQDDQTHHGQQVGAHKSCKKAATLVEIRWYPRIAPGGRGAHPPCTSQYNQQLHYRDDIAALSAIALTSNREQWME